LDHVLLGYSNTAPQVNPDEVADWKWMPLETVAQSLEQHPEEYTVWFKIIFNRFFQHLKNTTA
jgi:isopentenyl-diphosphate delta-isomerase